MVGVFFEYLFGRPKYFHGGKLEITPEQFSIADTLISQRAPLVQDVANMYGRDLNRVIGTEWLRNEVAEEVAIRHMASGGHVDLEELSKRVASRYEGRPVPPRYKKQFGDIYSHESALHVGRKVAGKMYHEHYAQGGQLSEDFVSIESFQVPNPNFPDDEWALHYGAENDCYATGGAITTKPYSKAWFIDMGQSLCMYIESHNGAAEMFDSFPQRPETNSGIRVVAYVSSWSDPEKAKLVDYALNTYAFKVYSEEKGKMVFVPKLMYKDGGKLNKAKQRELELRKRWIELNELLNLFEDAPAGYFSDEEDTELREYQDAEFRRLSKKKTRKLLSEIEAEANTLKPWVTGDLLDKSKVRPASEMLSQKHGKGGSISNEFFLSPYIEREGTPGLLEAEPEYSQSFSGSVNGAVEQGRKLFEEHPDITEIKVVKLGASVLKNKVVAKLKREGNGAKLFKKGGNLSSQSNKGTYYDEQNNEYTYSHYEKGVGHFLHSAKHNQLVFGGVNGISSRFSKKKYEEGGAILPASALSIVFEQDGHKTYTISPDSALHALFPGTYNDRDLSLINSGYELAIEKPSNEISEASEEHIKEQLRLIHGASEVATSLSSGPNPMLRFWVKPSFNERETELVKDGFSIVSEYDAPISPDGKSQIKGKIKEVYGADVTVTGSNGKIRFWVKAAGLPAKQYASGGSMANPYAICTASIGKTAGTTERSLWNVGESDRYEHCINAVKNKLYRGGKIEKETDLLPGLIAQLVAENVVFHNYSVQNKDLAIYEKDLLRDTKKMQKDLYEKAQETYKSNPSFKKKVSADGNLGRDFLYDQMYEWAGIGSQAKMKELTEQDAQKYLKEKDTLAFLKGKRPNVNPKADYVNAVLANDTESSDEELKNLFIQEIGLTDDQADIVLGFRKYFFQNHFYKLPL